MSVESAPLQGLTLYSHADDFRSHWIRYVLAEKQIKYNLILVDSDDEDLASLNPYNQLPMLIENDLKLFNTSIISEYIDDRYRQNKLYADARCHVRNSGNISGVLKMTGSNWRISCYATQIPWMLQPK